MLPWNSGTTQSLRPHLAGSSCYSDRTIVQDHCSTLRRKPCRTHETMEPTGRTTRWTHQRITRKSSDMLILTGPFLIAWRCSFSSAGERRRTSKLIAWQNHAACPKKIRIRSKTNADSSLQVIIYPPQSVSSDWRALLMVYTRSLPETKKRKIQQNSKRRKDYYSSWPKGDKRYTTTR